MSNVIPAILGSAFVAAAVGFGAGYYLSQEPTAENQQSESANEVAELNKKIENISAERDRARKEAKAARSSLKEVTSKPAPDEELSALKSSLQAKDEKIKELQDQLDKDDMSDALAEILGEPDTEALRKKSLEEFAAFEAAIESGDGDAAVKVIFALRDLGPEGYPEFFKAYEVLGAKGNPYAGTNELNIGTADFNLIMTKDHVLFAAKDDTGVAGLGGRIASAYTLNFVVPDMPKSERAMIFEGMAKTPNSGHLPDAAISMLTQLRSPEAGTSLVSIAMDSGVPASSRANAIRNLGSYYDSALNDNQIEELRRSSDPAISGAARYAGNARNPEATGYLISGFGSGSQGKLSGLQVGDIITHYQGTPVDSAATMSAWQKESEGKEVELAVRRDGKNVTVSAAGGALGVNGKIVKK